MKTVETRDVPTPKKSTFLSLEAKEPVTGLRGRKKMIWKRERAEIGSVTQKTHRHYSLYCVTIENVL